jgi:hypothetical protein
MKVLFIANSQFPDFQSDMVFHGGRSLYGDDFVDCNKLWYMYKEDKNEHWNNRIPNNGKDRGRGFTLYGRLDQGNIDRSNIESKIINHYFDKIIYGSVTRCFDHIELVRKFYDKKDVIFIDGEDDQAIREPLLEIGNYFKRELLPEDIRKARPISFAIPEELVLDNVPNKTREYATIIPGDTKTYIYDYESDYYDGYRESYFGITFKKGGWDCLRHYEILMNGCIPYWPDLISCPPTTMVSFPKKLVLDCNRKLISGELTEQESSAYIDLLLKYTKINLTTKQLFKSIITENISNSMKNTYIFICSYNRFEPLKSLISALTSRGYYNIVILDNGSTYQPLLDWYKTLDERLSVYFCANNYGPEALDCVRQLEPAFWEKYNHVILNEYHVYTDSDVIPVDEAPDSFIDDMVDLCKKYNIPKLGLSLKIDDLPDSYVLKEKVVKHESSFFEREYIVDDKCKLFKAPVDTTFAVNSPGLACGYSDYAYRAAGNYFARHAPWYFDSKNLPVDEIYYLKHIVGPRPHWSNSLKEIINLQ